MEGKTLFFVFNANIAIDGCTPSYLLRSRYYDHDSIAVGEDGPTHEPIEQLAALRAIPGLTVIRPSDANETASQRMLYSKRMVQSF